MANLGRQRRLKTGINCVTKGRRARVPDNAIAHLIDDIANTDLGLGIGAAKRAAPAAVAKNVWVGPK